MNERDRHREHSAPRARVEPAQRRATELRVFGLNACLAVFARRPQAIRKVYLTQQRLPALREVLAWCARERIGYRMVETADLEKLTRSEHHEGVCFEVLREPPLNLTAFLKAQRGDKPSWLVLLDGVGNPHNFGAVLRLAAHFGADAVLLPPGSSLALSGAACRVAEGGAEQVPLVALDDLGGALNALVRANYGVVATVVREGDDLYAAPLPRRAVFVFGAEGAGLSPALRTAAQRRVRIPGTGAVESLNIATAVAVVAAEFWRQYHLGAAR
jgi:TrmH RNA methyltransferase